MWTTALGAGKLLALYCALFPLATLAGCSLGAAPSASDAHVGDWPDMATPAWPPDGGLASLSVQIGFAGCPRLGGDGGAAMCTGAAPLSVTLVPLTSPGVTGYMWTIPEGGVPASSTQPSPLVTWAMPGHYVAYLAVVNGDNQSHATASAQIDVLPAATGGPCALSAQCGDGDDCRCASGGSDGGALCSADFSGGFCTRACTGGSCGDGQQCVDLSLSAAGDQRVAGDAFRHPLCLPTCDDSSNCLGGFRCRVVPALVDGADAGGKFSWVKACFADLLWSDGHACIDGDGHAVPSDCLGGQCLQLGVRNQCSSSCLDASSHPCAPNSACATFHFDEGHPVCLTRCDKANPCADPLLDCQAPQKDGWFGFSVDDHAPTTYCAPKRCASDKDCAAAGHCTDPSPPPDGGVADGGAADGGPEFCTP